jgi:transaldolase
MMQAVALPAKLAQKKIDLEDVAQQLETEGVKKFIEPFDKLLASLEQRCRQVIKGGS